MIPPEILNRLKRVELSTKKLVQTTIHGGYLSTFKGQGIEFDQVREYVEGDDIRSIDWNVTARFNHPYVRTYIEERELLVLLAVDVSGSFGFGTQQQLKRELALEFCACVAFSALQSHDRVGLLLFSDQVEKFISPRKGRRHIMRMMRELLYYQPRHSATDINSFLQYTARTFKKSATVFMVSDFIVDSIHESLLQRVAKKHDLIAVTIKDLAEEQMPRFGLIRLRDPETGVLRLVDTSSPRVLQAIQSLSQKRSAKMAQVFKKNGIDSIGLYTGQDPVKPLIRFFKEREKAR